MSSAERTRVIYVRTTAGPRVGLGHLRRCLTLATALRTRGADCRFLVDGDEAVCATVTRQEFPARPVAAGVAATRAALDRAADALVIDDYAFSAGELGELRGAIACTLVLDDLGKRAIDARLLLNAAPGADTLDYHTSDDCVRLFGARYALLRGPFRHRPPRIAAAKVARVLITFGGSDPTHATEATIGAVRAALPDTAVDVVIGPLFGRALAATPGVTQHLAPEELAPLMAAADLAVSAGGQTTYELAAIGTPTVALCTADNQRVNLRSLADVPTLVLAEPGSLAAALRALAGDRARRQALIERGQALFDGVGPDRVADAVYEALPEAPEGQSGAHGG